MAHKLICFVCRGNDSQLQTVNGTIVNSRLQLILVKMIIDLADMRYTHVLATVKPLYNEHA